MTSTQPRKAVSAAVDELERRLRPYVPDANRLLFSEKFVDWLTEQHWRHIPPPVTWQTSDIPNADVAHRGAAAAREALNRENDHTSGDSREALRGDTRDE